MNLGLFGIPYVKGINLVGSNVAYAAEEEEELPEGTRNLLLALILLYLLFFRQKQPAEAPPKGEVSVEEKGFEAPAIAPFKIGEEVKVNKSYTVRNAWKITLDSYQLFEGGAIEFNFLVENLQDEVARATIGSKTATAAGFTKGFTRLLDSQGNEYQDAHISKPGERDYIPNVPVEIKVSFFNLREDVKGLILYLIFGGESLLEKRSEAQTLVFGPIK